MCGPHHRLGRDAFASGPEILLRLLQLRQNASILEQGCAAFSPRSANRCDQCTRHSGRTSPPLRPSLSFRYTQVMEWLLPVAGSETFASSQHFVTDKELAKSYPVLDWANENALFDTLAGIEQPRKTSRNKTFWKPFEPVLTALLTRFLVPSSGWFGRGWLLFLCRYDRLDGNARSNVATLPLQTASSAIGP